MQVKKRKFKKHKYHITAIIKIDNNIKDVELRRKFFIELTVPVDKAQAYLISKILYPDMIISDVEIKDESKII